MHDFKRLINISLREGFSILYETGVRRESILRLFFCG